MRFLTICRVRSVDLLILNSDQLLIVRRRNPLDANETGLCLLDKSGYFSDTNYLVAYLKSDYDNYAILHRICFSINGPLAAVLAIICAHSSLRYLSNDKLKLRCLHIDELNRTKPNRIEMI